MATKEEDLISGGKKLFPGREINVFEKNKIIIPSRGIAGSYLPGPCKPIYLHSHCSSSSLLLDLDMAIRVVCCDIRIMKQTWRCPEETRAQGRCKPNIW